MGPNTYSEGIWKTRAILLPEVQAIFFPKEWPLKSFLASLRFSPIRGGFFFISSEVTANTKCHGDGDFAKIPWNYKS